MWHSLVPAKNVNMSKSCKGHGHPKTHPPQFFFFPLSKNIRKWDVICLVFSWASPRISKGWCFKYFPTGCNICSLFGCFRVALCMESQTRNMEFIEQLGGTSKDHQVHNL